MNKREKLPGFCQTSPPAPPLEGGAGSPPAWATLCTHLFDLGRKTYKTPKASKPNSHSHVCGKHVVISSTPAVLNNNDFGLN